MRDSVLEKFIEFTNPLEGYVPSMYVDRKGYLTTGYGDLIGTTPSLPNIPNNSQLTSYGRSIAWKRADGSRASQEEIEADAQALRDADANGGIRDAGGGNISRMGITRLHLTQDDIIKLTRDKLENFARGIAIDFPAFESWPADAQLGALSMAWAMGPRFGLKYPRFRAAANGTFPDFLAMAKESIIPELGMKPDGRNARQIQLFTNAANVLRSGANPDELYWPNEVVVKAGLGLVGVSVLAGGGYFLYQYLKGKGVL